jgi:prevent-host-death family protein
MYIIQMHRRIAASAARREFADIVNRACYSREITFLTRHGKDVAAVVPADTVVKDGETPPKKKPAKTR